MKEFKSVDNFLCGVQQSSAIPKTSDNGIFSLNITSLLSKTKTNILLSIIFGQYFYYLKHAYTHLHIYTQTYIFNFLFLGFP